MKIRHDDTPRVGQEVESTFVAYDDYGKELGGADVTEVMRDMLFPGRPHQLMVHTYCEPEALDALLGAATARAMFLARRMPNTPARIFTECDPRDKDYLTVLETQGYVNDDGKVRLTRDLRRGRIFRQCPRECVVLRDYLIDETESKYFLERYNATFGTDVDEEWLDELKRRPNFARFLAAAPDGLAGELVTWSDEDAGVVGIIQTPPHWQRHGVAGYLMEQAHDYWVNRGLRWAYFDVWVRLRGAVKLAASSGFERAVELKRYPGIDID